jgi:hypothetical protein
MERISIFNYEAFYLDFLEGNLSKEDTALLLAFLEEHPELKVDDDMFPTLEESPLHLENGFKAELKQILFNEDAITPVNVEQFMIAEQEGLLSKEKSAELERFVGRDKALLTTRKLYAASRLKPDLSLVFVDKKALKRAKRVVLWPYISIAAAASVAIFFLLWNPSAGLNTNTTGTVTSKFEQDSLKSNSNGNSNVQPKIPAIKEDQQSDDFFNQQRKAVQRTVENSSNEAPVELAVVDRTPKQNPQIGGLKSRQLREIGNKEIDLEVIEGNRSVAQTSTNPYVKKANNDYAMLGFEDMNNPIQPITNRLASAVKQEVDFRAAKATEKRSGGFYLKIGKLEISHREF